MRTHWASCRGGVSDLVADRSSHVKTVLDLNLMARSEPSCLVRSSNQDRSNLQEGHNLENHSDLKAISAMIEITAEKDLQELIVEVLSTDFVQRVSSRSFVSIERSGPGIRIIVRGRDLSSFRASLNSVMRLLGVMLGVLKAVSGTKDGK